MPSGTAITVYLWSAVATFLGVLIWLVADYCISHRRFIRYMEWRRVKQEIRDLARMRAANLPRKIR